MSEYQHDDWVDTEDYDNYYFDHYESEDPFDFGVNQSDYDDLDMFDDVPDDIDFV